MRAQHPVAERKFGLGCVLGDCFFHWRMVRLAISIAVIEAGSFCYCTAEANIFEKYGTFSLKIILFVGKKWGAGEGPRR